MIKKLSVFFLCLIMMFSFAACNNNTDLEKKISDLETRIADLEAKNKTLKNDNKTLFDSLAELEGKNDSLLETIGELEETIEGLRDEIFTADVFIYSYYDDFLTRFRTELTSMLLAAGISPTFYDGQSSQSHQTTQIETAISRGADLLIVTVVDSVNAAAVNNIINKAKTADIPVIFFNREITDTSLNSYAKTAYVGTNLGDDGRVQGQMIAEYLLKVENTTDGGTKSKFADTDGSVYYVMLRGEVGNLHAQYRTMYAVTEAQRLVTAAGKDWKLKSSPLNTYTEYSGMLDWWTNEFGEPLTDDEKVALSRYVYGNWMPDQAYDSCSIQFTAGNVADKSKLGIVISNNDWMAEGAIQALNDVGYNDGSANFIPVFGIDATEQAIGAIATGKMAGTIAQSIEAHVATIIHLALNVKAGKDIMSGTVIYKIDATANKIRIPLVIII